MQWMLFFLRKANEWKGTEQFFLFVCFFFSGGKSKHPLEVNPPKHGMMLTPFLLEFKNKNKTGLA